MLPTKRTPVTVGEILNEEFMQPMGLTQATFADIVLNAQTWTALRIFMF
jgi:plasmid maintenance system antidote protein VapI